MSTDASKKRRRKRQTRAGIPGRRRSVELHAQYVKLLILVITAIINMLR